MNEPAPSNREAAAAASARAAEAAYIAKRGGSAPPRAAQNVYDWAFRRFMATPDDQEKSA